MIRIILCEGETDATLLGLYLENICGWAYAKNPKLQIKLPKTNPITNEKSVTYSNGTEELIICAVGGKDKFGQFYNEYIHNIVYLSQDKEINFRIALMTDADNRTCREIEEDILRQLSPHISNIKSAMWTSNTVENSFKTLSNVEFLLTIIPVTGQGALETVLMDSLAEMNSGDTIVESSKIFVDALAPNEYLSADRLKLKAKLGVALSVFYPDKVFSQFDQQLKIVDWSKSTTLAQCLAELVKI